MRNFFKTGIRHVLAGSIAVLLLQTGCSSGGATSNPNATSVIPAAPALRTDGIGSSKFVYVADAQGFLQILNSAGQNVGQIADGIFSGSFALAVDPAGSLYVGNFSGAEVVVYNPKLPQLPAGFYRDPVTRGSFPVGIAIHKDLLYVALNENASHGPGAIYEYKITSEYPQGGNGPVRVISPPANTEPAAVAVDARGNVYAEWRRLGAFPQPGYFYKYRPHSTKGTYLGISVGDPGYGLAVDSGGNLIACDNEAAQIDVFTRTKRGKYRKKPRAINQGLKDCVAFALSADEKTLFVTDQPLVFGTYSPPADVKVYRYATGTLLKTFSQGIEQSHPILWGIAVQ